MRKKGIGYIAALFIIGTMVVLMIKTNMDDRKPLESFEEVEEYRKSAAGQDENSTVPEGLERGDTPPDFKLSTLSGEVIKLSDLKGQKVILNFWASWCGPCKAEMPHMQNYYDTYKDEANVEIVAVNMTTQERRGLKGIEEFIEDYELTFPIPLDEKGEIIDAYRVMTIPTTYMIGTDGTIGHVFFGPMDEKTIHNLVDQLE